jgi:Cof subfamily protein (haloacid dehalogenase superfamily)
VPIAARVPLALGRDSALGESFEPRLSDRVLRLVSNELPIRAVVTDLDGTLLRSDGTLSPYSIDVIRSFSRRGLPIFAATARPPASAVSVVREMDLEAPVVCVNGACAVDPIRGQFLFVEPFRRTRVRRLIRTLQASFADAAFAFETPGGRFIDRRWNASFMSEHATVLRLRGDLPDLPVLCVMATGLTALPTVAHLLRRRRVHITSSRNGLLEFTMPAATKASALTRILAMCNLDWRDVIAFGDMPNDIRMLRAARIGVAVANAHPSVLASATSTTASNDNDGVARFLVSSLR